MTEKGDNFTHLGALVRSRRHAKDLTLDQAEQRSGVDATYWSKLEHGEYRSPNPRYLQAIAHTLDLPVEELYALAGYYLPARMPSFAPYLRARYELDDAEIHELFEVFERVRSRDRGAESGDDGREA